MINRDIDTPTPEPQRFKFRWLKEDGSEAAFSRKKKGSFDGETLVLDDISVPASQIIAVEAYEGRLVMSFVSPDGTVDSAGFRAYKISATDLKLDVDVARSGMWAEMTREKMTAAGRGAWFRTIRCPQCRATLDLSEMEDTPQVYCHFCETLSTVEQSGGILDEHDFGLCEECGMFSRPRKFTIFYFYFLLVVWGWHSSVTNRCPACMRGNAWKMLFGNLPFVLGVPTAVVQLFRCYGGKITGSVTAGLDDANLKARKGDVLAALQSYGRILEQVPWSAGIKYNVALALLQQNEIERAAESLRLALKDCANYAPAYPLLVGCYDELGEQDQLTELRRVWGDDGDEEEPSVEGEPENSGAVPGSLDDDDAWGR
ncbi:MAG: tetratricopeptide repeat protein [Planctomycetaceae bacterium]|nr:tetratricopeptide repeat protein [Planctomycetaceae bacterium]